MKHFKKIVSLILTLVFVLPLIPLSASGAAEDSAFYLLPEDNEGLTFSVGSYEKTSNQSYMFLPNTVAPECVKVRYSADFGEVSGFSVTEWNEDEKYFVVDTTADSEVWVDNKVLTFMQSCLPSISIDINEGESLSTIHADKNAKIGAKASISGASKDKYNLAPTDIQFKTRGYSSFSAPKKPYQIKFDKKQDLFGLGKAKKWILLANYFDGSSIRTKVFFDLADEIGLSYTSQSVFVDLYIDGAYQGVYQVIEKIEVGDARVPLKNELGAILEMECNPRVEASDIWFTSSVTDKAFLYKDYVTDLEDTSTPEKAEKVSEVKQFIEARINAFEEAIYADEPDWDLISSMIDVDSFIKYYFLNEYGEQTDCTFSSTYFYIDGPEDVIHCGPVWDFDRACGFNREIPQNSDFLKNIDEYTDGYRVEWFKQLFRNPEFVVRANEIYDEVIRDAFDTDKVTAAIDEAQAAIMPSLLMNHVIWVVSFNDYHTANDVVSGGTAARVAHTTNSIKTIITNKKAYLDTAYGVDIPVISYTCYKTDGTA
ncbi:MAG: CotH kinase family protein, partial [Clostridia bacterium]|nr:CotH kinase family protein [Clostridia bacterium]